jgi:hypothetical protein
MFLGPEAWGCANGGGATSDSKEPEDLLWRRLEQLGPEDGLLRVCGINDGEAVPAFTDFGIETLREIIRDQID